MVKSSILLDLNDPRANKIADAISNKTSKKILALLSEKEMSGGDISKQLNLPLNTVTYNLKTLVEAGLIEKSRKFFWSSKGRRIEIYKIINKRIVIMPRTMIKGILPSLIIVGVFAFGIKLWTDSRIKSLSTNDVPRSFAENAGDLATKAAESTPIGQTVSEKISEGILSIAQSSWLWFLSGALIALFAYLMYNYIKNEKDNWFKNI